MDHANINQNISTLGSQNDRGNLGALGWQATRTSIRDRHVHLLMNETLADIFFLFRGPNGVVHRIPAHKFVLSIGSSVFEAMFRFNDSSSDEGTFNNIRELELVDVERGALEALLTFLYIDDIQAINEESVMSILYTAKKYAVLTLEAACVRFLENCISKENAFMLLSKARFYDEKHLADKCLKIIDENAPEALKSDDFLGIDRETLCRLFARNTLRVKELTLFEAAIRWALRACEFQNLPPTPDNQRLVLGSALHQIRFPLMSQTDFAKHVASSKLLLDSEIVSVFLYYNNGPEHPMPFSSSCREHLQEMVVKRFQQVLQPSTANGWNYSRGIPDRIKFEVDTPILILGFGLYGSYLESCTYSVLIELFKFSTCFSINLLASKECSFLSDGSPTTFRVMFEEPAEIDPNTSYVASAKLTGANSHYGAEGLNRIKVERNGLPDINWHFHYTPEMFNNGTSIIMGQIPEIIFCAKHPH